jgi:hypothetical protein
MVISTCVVLLLTRVPSHRPAPSQGSVPPPPSRPPSCPPAPPPPRVSPRAAAPPPRVASPPAAAAPASPPAAAAQRRGSSCSGGSPPAPCRLLDARGWKAAARGRRHLGVPCAPPSPAPALRAPHTRQAAASESKEGSKGVVAWYRHQLACGPGVHENRCAPGGGVGGAPRMRVYSWVSKLATISMSVAAPQCPPQERQGERTSLSGSSVLVCWHERVPPATTNALSSTSIGTAKALRMGWSRFQLYRRASGECTSRNVCNGAGGSPACVPTSDSAAATPCARFPRET